MKKISLCALVALLTLCPSAARADSGFIEWLDSFSGPGPFWGYGFDTRIVCIGAAGRVHSCVSDVGDVKWVITAEGGFYTSHDNPRFEDTAGDSRSVHLVSVVPKLSYRVHPVVDVSVGFGLVALSGDGFETFYRPQIPIGVSIVPLGFLRGGNAEKWGRVFRVQLNEDFIAKGLTGADLASPSNFSAGGEFHKSIAFVFDFGVLRAAGVPR
jgi:hypothetical protein